MPMQIQTSETEMVVHRTGEIDHHSAKGMREEIDQVAQRLQPRRMILDFGEITFMDSSGIGLVLGRYSLMQSLGGDLELTRVPGHIQKVMRMAGLDRLTTQEQGGNNR